MPKHSSKADRRLGHEGFPSDAGRLRAAQHPRAFRLWLLVGVGRKGRHSYDESRAWVRLRRVRVKGLPMHGRVLMQLSMQEGLCAYGAVASCTYVCCVWLGAASRSSWRKRFSANSKPEPPAPALSRPQGSLIARPPRDPWCSVEVVAGTQRQRKIEALRRRGGFLGSAPVLFLQAIEQSGLTPRRLTTPPEVPRPTPPLRPRS